jgi:hypothetical protein
MRERADDLESEDVPSDVKAETRELVAALRELLAEQRRRH